MPHLLLLQNILISGSCSSSLVLLSLVILVPLWHKSGMVIGLHCTLFPTLCHLHPDLDPDPDPHHWAVMCSKAYLK